MKTRSLILIVLLILAALVVPALAQDDLPTDEPTAVATEAPVVVDPPVVTTPPAVMDVSTIIFIVIGAFSGGVVISLAGAYAIIVRVTKDPQAMRAIESLGNSVPESTANRLIDLLKVTEKISEVGQEALDRVPFDQKPGYVPPVAPEG